MLPDIGGSELLVIAAVALIVVGPKDLPVLLRKLGQFVARMRGMAAEFRSSFDEMARQSELDELRREVAAMRSGQFTSPVQDAVKSASDVGVDQVFADIDASLNSGAVQPYPFAARASSEPSILPPEVPVEAPATKVRKPRAPKAVAHAEKVVTEPLATKAKARTKTPAVADNDTPKPTRAPRKRTARAGDSTASDITS
ncbi:MULTISPECIES: Sec-independent protein translocase protein TatB [unclassified Caulobacter]|uniref:Sec-independent protein translocase protein TatB n=1 Tax=unclassified Caulobacter TaxID=2648921 RepID=UPI000D39E4B5|nr:MULTISPECIES: Sec-independent protein translocase protein TatB [unclassified Caulobacter]PTS90181.1 twin-arginine translocase subunit TatB [Caulobacter sp. HMWF009]PTT08171.1 twin-arginine translocase subunit TatB [Caulobacter sp. HMWF025]